MSKTQLALLEQLQSDVDAIRTEIRKQIVGQEHIIDMLIVSILCRGHALLVGVPGLAKTLLIQTIANIIGAEFKRIQFTPDLMPSDITGTEILDVDETGRRQFKFIKGPLFTNILLADEINRTPPKTQSALLEAMQERMVTVGGDNYQLDDPFFVLATQNPIEQEGTYPLPEAQLDRFMLMLNLDYPTEAQEIDIVRKTTIGNTETVTNLNLKERLTDYQELIQQIEVPDNVIEYAVKMVQLTRPNEGNELHEWIRYGAGPRASQFLVKGAKALAAMSGDVLPERRHVDAVADAVLQHRIMLTFAGEAEGWTIRRVIDEIRSKMT